MAVLGPQMVITLIAIFVVQKFAMHFSFAQWLLCSTGLFRYLYPTNSELKALMRGPNSKKAKKIPKFENEKGSDKFYVPKHLDIELKSIPVSLSEIQSLRYYWEYHWLIDFSYYATIVYFSTEVARYYFPSSSDINLSMIWCFIVVVFAFKTILSLTFEFFKNPESIGERSTVIVTFFLYLLLVMTILIVDESLLETGINDAYSNFTESASAYLKHQQFATQGPASKLILMFCLAVCCSIIGAVFVFPGFRLSEMHWDALRYCDDRIIIRFILQLNFVAPLVLTLLWVKPLANDYLTVRVLSGMNKPLLSQRSFESMRILLVILVMFLRISLLPIYLQAYLNMAYDRICNLKKEVGRITNIDLQKKVASVFYYTCAVVLHYMIPLVVCLNLCFMYKTLGSFSWSDLILGDNSTTVMNNSNDTLSSNETLSQLNDLYDNISNIHASQSNVIFENSDSGSKRIVVNSLNQVFSNYVFRGLFGFLMWWTCLSWFISSVIGLLYHKYFQSSTYNF